MGRGPASVPDPPVSPLRKGGRRQTNASHGPGPRGGRGGTGQARLWRACVAILSAIPILVAGCSEPSATSSARADAPSSRPIAKVEVVRPERHDVKKTTEQPGQIEAVEVTPIHAKLSGYAREVAVDIGDRVKKGQVLVELSVPEIEADVQQKKAMVEQAEARLAQARAAVKVAEAGLASAKAKMAVVQSGIKRVEADLARWQSEYQRTQQLVSERAVTSSVLDESRNKLRSAEASRDSVSAEVLSAEAALNEGRAELDKARSDATAASSGIEVAKSEARRAEALLGYSKIVAPFDGVVTRRHVDTGHLTVAGPQGDPLFVIARSGVVTVAVGVPELFAPSVGKGDAAAVRIQALGGKEVEGTVTRTAYVLDSSTRTLRAEIDLPNDDGSLRPGLYAYAAIVADEHKDVLTVPSSAIVREGDKAFCVRVVNDRAVRTPVELGLSDGTRTEIVSGLGGDDLVVKANSASLTDDQPVKAAEAAEPAAPKTKP
jgi:HlyD family secretion protein